MSSSQRTIKLITVNTAPERAKLLIGRFAKRLPSKYVISYVDNCSSKSEYRLQGQNSGTNVPVQQSAMLPKNWPNTSQTFWYVFFAGGARLGTTELTFLFLVFCVNVDSRRSSADP